MSLVFTASARPRRISINNSAATLEDVVDHYIEVFKFAIANAAPGVVPPFTTTDGVHFDRAPTPEERAALVAYLKKL